MKKGIEIAVYIICAVILVWFIISWIDVCLHNGNENPQYASWNMFTLLTTTETETDSCTVVSCVKANGNYRVTIEDSNGNLWAYYDSGSREIGEEITPIWDGNNEIVGLKGEN